MLGAWYWQSLNSGIAIITIPYKRDRSATVQHRGVPSGRLAGSVGFKRRRASHAVEKEQPVRNYLSTADDEVRKLHAARSARCLGYAEGHSAPLRMQR